MRAKRRQNSVPEFCKISSSGKAKPKRLQHRIASGLFFSKKITTGGLWRTYINRLKEYTKCRDTRLESVRSLHTHSFSLAHLEVFTISSLRETKDCSFFEIEHIDSRYLTMFNSVVRKVEMGDKFENVTVESGLACTFNIERVFHIGKKKNNNKMISSKLKLTYGPGMSPTSFDDHQADSI